jgi:hypothetical protein
VDTPCTGRLANVDQVVPVTIATFDVVNQELDCVFIGVFTVVQRETHVQFKVKTFSAYFITIREFVADFKGHDEV